MSAVLTASQRAKVANVMQFTTCGPKQAQQVLARNQWNVEVAVNELFEIGIEYEAPAAPTSAQSRSSSSAPAAASAASASKLNLLFDHYAKLDYSPDQDDDSSSDLMGVNGLVQFFSDIGVDDPEADPIVLVLAYKMQAKEMLQYTREEFVRGLQAMQCTQASELGAALPTLRHQFATTDRVFWDVYHHSFVYGLAPGQKVLTKDTALALWRMLVSADRFPLMPQFLDYFQRTAKHGVNKDLWQQLRALVLLHEQHGDRFLEEFAKISSWPLVFDEFVDSLRAAKS